MLLVACMSRLRAGSLYAGDGVVIQVTNSRALLATLTRVTFSFQPAACPSSGCTGCSTLLRYARSSFGSGNITLCVQDAFDLIFLCVSHTASFFGAASGLAPAPWAAPSLQLNQTFFNPTERLQGAQLSLAASPFKCRPMAA